MHYRERGTRFVDVTGDGKADLLRSINYSTGSKTREFYQNQFNGSFSWVSRQCHQHIASDVRIRARTGGSTVDYATGLFGT